MVGLLALALMACGSPTHSDAVGIVDGSILSARYYEADGVRVFRGWHDRGLDIECSFQVASDGLYRCLPSGMDVGYSGSEFGDADCTRPVLIATACNVPRYAFGAARPTPLCAEPSGHAVLAVGAERASGTYYRSVDGVCTAFTVGNYEVVHDISGRLDADNFVAAELAPTTTDALAPYAYVATDGAIEAASVWDTARAAECRPDGEDVDTLHCAPTEVAFYDRALWADGGCTIPVATDDGSARPCGVPTAVLKFQSGVSSYAELGAAVPPTSIRTSDTGAGCTLAAPNRVAGVEFYLHGAALPLDQLPAMPQVLDGDGRLRAERYTDAEGHDLTHAQGFYDTLVGESCWPYPFADGTLRCVTSYSGASPPKSNGTYGDPACTQPLVISSATSPPPTLVLTERPPVKTCEQVVFEGARTSGAEFVGQLFQGIGCLPVPRDPSYRYYSVGPPVELPIVNEL